MATFEQVMQALRNADAAGDAGAAQRLAQIAQSMRAKPVGPQGEDLTTGPVNPPAFEDQSPIQPQENRFGDVVADVTAEPIAAMKAYAGGLVDQSKSPTLAALPEDWNPALKRLYAYGGDAAMAGLSALGTAYSGAAGLAAEAIAGDKTQEQRLARDLMMAGQVAVPELAGVSSVNRAAAAGSRAAQRAENVKPPTPKQAAARAADDLGITPSLGMTGKSGAMTAAGLEKVPLTGSIVARDAARAVGEVEGAYARILGRLGNAKAPFEAGDVLQSGLKSFVSKFKTRSGELFDEVGKKIPAGTKVQAPSFVQVVDDLKSVFAENPELAKRVGVANWDTVADELRANGLPWDALKQFRTEIGQAKSVGGSTVLSDTSKVRLDRIYAALTNDMEAAAKAAGKDAYQAWTRANAYYRTGAKRIERSLDKTITAQSPERAFEAFSALTKADRSTADITRMRQIKASMSRDDWNDVSASIVDRLGRAKAGAQGADGATFSPGTFLTEWNKLSPEAKRLLLPDDIRVEMEKLARVSESVKAANAERNFSNTGTVAGLLATGAGGMASPVATASALAGANISARGLTNVSFLRALNKAQRGDTRALQAMARSNGTIARDAETILRLMAAETAQAGSANADRQPIRAISQ